jgi:hypothetical protein
VKKNILIVVALAVAPHADLVKVVQAEAPGDRVEQVGVLDRDGDDVGDVELEEEDVVEEAVDVRVADEDEDEEGDGDEVAEAGDDGGPLPHGHGLGDHDCHEEAKREKQKKQGE